jgi:hypothetical protein
MKNPKHSKFITLENQDELGCSIPVGAAFSYSLLKNTEVEFEVNICARKFEVGDREHL